MSENRKVEALTAIEWYDGIVTGFIRLLSSNFFCVMLAFDPDSSRRCYALVPIAPGTFPSLALGGLVDYLQSALDDALAASLEIYLTRNEPTVGGDIEIEPMDRGHVTLIRTLSFPRIDEAVLRNAHIQWL